MSSLLSTHVNGGGVLSSLPTAHIKPGKARLFQEGNPIVYNGVISHLSEGSIPSAGDEILVSDHLGNVIGKGVYNPHSLYRVRMLALKSEACFALPLQEILRLRIQSAYRLRQDCLSLLGAGTNAYRLINSEGDRLSGLVVDVFGDVAVAQSAAFWIEKKRNMIVESLQSVLGPSIRVVWKRSSNFLKLDGFEAASEADSEMPTADYLIDVNIEENGINYTVKPGFGQKTGFYCDQRSNRMLMRTICSGNLIHVYICSYIRVMWIGLYQSDKRVLDLFCFSGGFSLNALAGGCSRYVH